MAITTRNPNRIVISLKGGYRENRYVAAEAISPGHRIVLKNDSGTLKWYKLDSSTEFRQIAVAEEQTMQNLTVTDNYAAGDLVEAAILRNGDQHWGIIPSGQNITQGDYLEGAAGGWLEAASPTTAAGNVALHQAMESKNATANTFIKVQVTR